ncbi:MAG: hypothetical protein KC964_00835 [Candidatus Omnitrophica bacterium]|nr:hypothetical protein [Candidatus Omnitrophota bacterium]
MKDYFWFESRKSTEVALRVIRDKDKRLKALRTCIAYLLISFISSLLFAVAFVVVLTMTLPETDGAYGQMPFEDPFVFPIMRTWAIFSALVVWPFYVLCGWNLSPIRLGALVGIPTLVFIVFVTPFSPAAGWLGSYAVLIFSLIVSWFWMNDFGSTGENKSVESNDKQIFPPTVEPPSNC